MNVMHSYLGRYKHITIIETYCSAKNTHMKRVFFAVVCEHVQKKASLQKGNHGGTFSPSFPLALPLSSPFLYLRKRFNARGQKRANKPPNAFSKTAVFWAVAF